MLTIRLQRAGKTNQAEFRIILAEKTAAANKKFVEVLGHYNPRTKAFGVKEDRLKYWIDQHVSISPTAHNLFVTKNLLESVKVKAFSVPKKPAEPTAEASPVVADSPSPEAAVESSEVAAESSAAEAIVAEEIKPETEQAA